MKVLSPKYMVVVTPKMKVVGSQGIGIGYGCTRLHSAKSLTFVDHAKPDEMIECNVLYQSIIVYVTVCVYTYIVLAYACIHTTIGRCAWHFHSRSYGNKTHRYALTSSCRKLIHFSHLWLAWFLLALQNVLVDDTRWHGNVACVWLSLLLVDAMTHVPYMQPWKWNASCSHFIVSQVWCSLDQFRRPNHQHTTSN